jgi:biopolymer transport protein ExbB
LRKYLRVFNAISTICPLLGLLGTVFGIIKNFNAIARSQALGRAELLAGGIGEALLATAAGLSVAIPALVFYWYFVSRVDQLVVEIDSLGQDLVNLIAVDGDHELTPPKAVRTRRREPTA